jgi:hypothetical protein
MMNTIRTTTATIVLTSEPRPRYVYEGKTRTDQQVVDESTGQPQWQARGLVHLEVLGVIEGTLRIPQSLVTEKLVPGEVVTATGEPLRIGLRGGDYASVLVAVEGVTGVDTHGLFAQLATATRPLKAASNG